MTPLLLGLRGWAGGATGEGCSRQRGLGSGAQDKEEMETSLEVQWLGLRASNAWHTGSSPVQGTKIPHAMGRDQKKFKKTRRRWKPKRWEGRMEAFPFSLGFQAACWVRGARDRASSFTVAPEPEAAPASTSPETSTPHPGGRRSREPISHRPWARRLQARLELWWGYRVTLDQGVGGMQEVGWDRATGVSEAGEGASSSVSGLRI